MADEVDSKSIGSDTVRVQVPQPALLGRGESLKNNIVYVIFKAFSFLATLFHSAAVRSRGAFFCVIGRSFLGHKKRYSYRY